MPRLNSSSSLSLAPEQRGSSPANVHGDTAGLHGTKETLVTLGKQGEHCDTWHVTEPSVHGDTADPHGNKENSVILRSLMEFRSHCDTSGPHGTKESIVALQGLMESRNPCDTGEANGTKCLL